MNEPQEYPKMLRHPAERSATVNVTATDPRTGRQTFGPGEPAMYPPVLVNDADQEEYQKAQGYETVGTYSPAAFAQAAANPNPVNHKPVEYPKWVDGVLVNSEDEELAAMEVATDPAPKARGKVAA